MACCDEKDIPKSAKESSSTYQLSLEEVQYYNENGYVVVKKLIEQTALDNYRERFRQYCDGLEPRGSLRIIKERKLIQDNAKPEDYINKLHDIFEDEVFITYGRHPSILSVVSQLIGDDITLISSVLINKPPGASRHPPHQDLIYLPIRPAEKIVTSWTAIDPVTYENGCLYVIPGSHKPKELYAHQTREDTLRYFHGVDEATVAPPEKYVHLEMSPGDTVFFHPCVLHGSGANSSKAYRKAISFFFANSSCHYIDVKNTVQESIEQDIKDAATKMGVELNLVEMYQLLGMQLKGVRSNL